MQNTPTIPVSPNTTNVANFVTILAFSDLHLNHKAAENIIHQAQSADIVIGAGDFAQKGDDLAGFMPLFNDIPCPIIIVAGNHDDIGELRHHCANQPHIYVLHGTGMRLLGLEFFGLGYECPISNNESWNRALDEDEADILLSACPERAVLVTHAPPHGIADQQKNGFHAGSHAIYAAIMQKQPLLHVCGHIHAAWGQSGTIGQTPIHNLGPAGKMFKLPVPSR
ncbi:metallophosphoesterase [Thalassospira sp. MCCC 1A01428]|uniref:metallophosphoesterase family protein n=1 Tax=Thalassospira sp. MCCC 1A01428 TaxID=1470575 RepID=UPI000A1E7C0E|nr:metallophosphoesterase [Thalassospira sp. MCCC 1A01428]